MKLCPTCNSQYPDDANFCPQETCATPDGPQRLILQPEVQPPGRFQLGEQVGGTRTGAVYRALDTKTGTQVALKVVSGHVLPTPALFARADREFKQLIRVASPKIVTIIDCSKTADGQLAIAMEYCAGESLEKRLFQGAVDFDTAKSIVLQVGQALLEAQKAGLVHRDISPKNILLSLSGEAKIINFPIAKPINDKVSGFAGYLSPEQIQGKPIDQRSNTYGLAALLYHLATGELPFQASSEASILEMHLSSPVLPPSQRRPGSILPAELDKLIAKAMDKSSSRRHLTLRLFLSELEALRPFIPAPAAAKAAEQPALAKTMMFGGNQADVARLVAEAKAAKAAENSTRSNPTESPLPSSSVPLPAHDPSPSSTIAPVATLASSAPKIQPNFASTPTIAQQASSPAPVTPESFESLPVTPPPQSQSSTPPVTSALPSSRPNPVAEPSEPKMVPIRPAEAGNAPPPKAGAAFRETLWFKKGDVEQMVADAKAKMQNQGKPGVEPAPELTEDVRPLEDRYVDDGSVTVEDRKKFSLRTGGTATALPNVSTAVPGEKIDERQLVGEIGTGRRTLILIIAVAIILALAVVVLMMIRGRGESSAPHQVQTESTSAAIAPAAAPNPAIPKPEPPVPNPETLPPESATIPVAAKAEDKQKDSDDEKGESPKGAAKKKIVKKKARQR